MAVPPARSFALIKDDRFRDLSAAHADLGDASVESSLTAASVSATSVSSTSLSATNASVFDTLFVGVKTSTSKLNISGIPTSPVGLVSGDVWSNAGVLNIVP